MFPDLFLLKIATACGSKKSLKSYRGMELNMITVVFKQYFNSECWLKTD